MKYLRITYCKYLFDVKPFFKRTIKKILVYWNEPHITVINMPVKVYFIALGKVMEFRFTIDKCFNSGLI